MRFGRSFAQRDQPPDLQNDARSVGPSHIIRGRRRPRNWWWRHGSQPVPGLRTDWSQQRPLLGGSWKSLGYRRGDFHANHELGAPYQRVPFRRRSGGHRARASRRPRIPAWLEPRRVDGSLVELLYADHGSGIGPIGGSWTRWPSVCAFPLTVLRLLSAGLGTRARLRSLSPSSTRSNRADCAMGIWYS